MVTGNKTDASLSLWNNGWVGKKTKGGGKIYYLNKYMCGGKLKKKPQKSKKKAGSDSPEIVFDLAEFYRLKCLDQEKCQGFLNSLNETITPQVR